MTNEKAIALLETGSKLPSTPHTAEMLDEACKLACRALKRPPNLCTILGVWPEQVFNWRGYTLKVRSDGVIGKKMVGDSWPGLEGPMVCELINNADEIMRQVQLDLASEGSKAPIHARWIKPVPGDGENYCSACKADQPWFAGYGYFEPDYCPNCGAKMDLEVP